MKRIIFCVLALLFGWFFLYSATASASTVYNYTDDYANWPGYPEPPYPVNPADQIGDWPTISGAKITIDDSGFLESVEMLVTNRRPDTLFINGLWNPGSTYDTWDYFVGIGTGALFYEVTNPYDYILVECPPSAPGCIWRVGHPFAIDPADLTVKAGFLTGVTYDGSILKYSFVQGQIQMTDPNNPNVRFVVGYSADCGNDVFLTPVPEPMTMLLLGIGLLGVAGIRRRLS